MLEEKTEKDSKENKTFDLPDDGNVLKPHY